MDDNLVVHRARSYHVDRILDNMSNGQHDGAKAAGGIPGDCDPEDQTKPVELQQIERRQELEHVNNYKKAGIAPLHERPEDSIRSPSRSQSRHTESNNPLAKIRWL
jgi:hypothetical protein